MSFSFLDKLSSNTTDEEKDEFDLIKCPNTFDDDSQVDRFFDTHNSTPSPKLRRSQRIKAKLSDGKPVAPQPTKKAVELRTPPKTNSAVSSYASCSSSTPYGTPQADMKKAATTPGPPPRSLLKLAIGNSLRNKPLVDDALAVHPKPRKGPRTSTPKQFTKVVKLTRSVKENEAPPITEEPETGKQDTSNRKTVLVSKPATVVKSDARRTVVKADSRRTAVKRTFSNSTIMSNAGTASALEASNRVAAPPMDLAASRTAPPKTAKKPEVKPKAEQAPPKTKKSISQKLQSVDRPKKRRSLKSIVKKRQSDGKKADVSKNRVAAARKAASGNRAASAVVASAGASGKTQKASGEQYAHIKSRVAQMINSGPVVSGPNVRDMKKRAAELKTSKPVLHEKPFLPAGKVKYTTTVDVVPGDLTVNGQTMAQFVKNFHYQTPPRYRALKPTDTFHNTCTNHNVQGPSRTIPKSPKFATNNRRRNTVKH